jgi:hypothetical protein
MDRNRLLASLFFASTLLWQCGCPAGSSKHTYPPDPLFISKKPQEVPASPEMPVVSAHAEPQIPPKPAVVRLAAKN